MDLTTEESRLLLYMETQAVDYGGLLQSVRMNSDDFAIAARWNESGFVQFGRIAANDITPTGNNYPRTHWCLLSDAAWEVVYAVRRARCKTKMDGLEVQRVGLVESAKVPATLSYEKKSFEILESIAKAAAGGQSLTITEDWGHGSATLIDQDGAHTHVGYDGHADERLGLNALIDGLHNLLVKGAGLTWVQPATEANRRDRGTDQP
jgi:hypothetical protein